MTDERRLTEVIERIIDAKNGAVSIAPAWVANEAMQELDPERASPMLVHSGCNLQLRQIARSVLRRKFRPNDEEGEGDQHELFPRLQTRYPTARSAQAEEPEYVLLEHLTGTDIAYNIARLRSEARAKLAHADALEAYSEEHPPAAVA